MQLYRKRGIYEKYIKRLLDIVFAMAFLILFFWVYALIALLVRIKLGSPVIFTQFRPGLINHKTGKEKIFKLYKFRSMSDARDENGNLFPDEVRLGKFGKALRASSLDELPEIVNILKGDMSFVGPRPQLVRDMVFMSDEVRMRHTARAGLTGLAQVKGRNAITWEDKFEWDLRYIKRVSFLNDLKIIGLTIKDLFGTSDDSYEISKTDVTDDYGDYLLKKELISKEDYDAKQQYAGKLLESIK